MINIGILAHVDAGKTTLTEQILYLSGKIREKGDVDNGTSKSDWLPVERERGISVRASTVSVEWNGAVINIIDTPGHAEFISEVERSLSVLDAAVIVISAVEGIQAQTEILIKAADNLSLPFFIFINKMDRAGSDYKKILNDLRIRGLNVAEFTEYENESSDNLKVTALKTDSEELVMACSDEKLLENYFENKILDSDIYKALKKQVLKDLRPVFCGSSKSGAGVTILMDGIAALCTERTASDNDPLTAKVYKIEHDKTFGKIACVRVFNGMIKSRDSVYIKRTESFEKVTQVRSILGDKMADIGVVGHSGVAALCGLSGVKAGDVLGENAFDIPQCSLTVPLITVRAVSDTSDYTRLAQALSELCDEDPQLSFVWIKEKKELHLNTTGKIQLEILKIILKQRYNIEADFIKPSIIYKETPASRAEGFEAYTMPKPCWAVVKFIIEPLPRGSGVQYESRVSNQKILYRYQNHIKTAVPRALEQGLYGWEVTDIKITLTDGESHFIHTHPLDFFVATPMGIMNGLKNAGTKLIEPYLKVTLTASEEYLGKTISMIVGARGNFDSPVVKNGSFTAEAFIPAEEAMDLPAEFSSMTSGKGIYYASFSHYEDYNGEIKTAERRGVDPLDRSKYILWARQALK